MSRAQSILAISSYFKGNRFLEACKEQNVSVTLLTIEKLLAEPWARHACSDLFAVNSFLDRKQLVNAVSYLMRSKTFDRIVALDDFDVEIAAFLREHFRMTDNGHGETAARYFRDKLAMRHRAKELGIRCPNFVRLVNDDEINNFLKQINGPWLIKPRSEASAAGIRKLHNNDEVWQRIHELGDERSNFLLEEMVPGDLFHVDTLSYDGQVIFSEVNGYWRPLLDVYQGGGVYATRTMPRDRPDIRDLKATNTALLKGFGLEFGASHTEYMKAHRDGQYYFIETSCRVGGSNTAEMVEHAAGPNLWAEWAKIEISRGTKEYSLPAVKQKFAGVVMSLSRFETPDTSSFTAAEIVQRVEMKNHIGFVFCSDSQQRIEQLLTEHIERIGRDFGAAMPAQDSVGH